MNKKKNFSGYLGDCSEQQLKVLAEFRDRARAMGCSDPPYDDVYFLRFLRARKFDLEKSTNMWKNYINWRAERNVDEIKKMDFSDVNRAKQYYPHLWFRTDKLGRPVFYERLGKLSFDKLTKEVSTERLELHFIQDYERLLNDMFPACTKAKGELVTNTCYIMDLKGVSAKMFSGKVWDLLKIASRIGQDYYPEILGNMFIINVPMFFHGMWNMIKVFVDEKTRSKIHILGSGYKKELLKYVDEKDLPDFLGGKATVEDYGENFSNEQGPWIEKPLISVQPARDENQLSNTDIRTIEEEDKLGSHERIDHSREDVKHIKSLPVLVDSHNSLGENDNYDIGQESPIKQFVRNFPQKASLSVNMLASLNSIGDL